MMFIKNSFWFGCLFFFSVVWCGDWVLKYKNTTWFEEDFYNYFPQSEWRSLGEDLQKKVDVFDSFIKQQSSVWEAINLGLHNDAEVSKKLKGRFDRLLVNEYYMRKFLGSVVPLRFLSFCQKNLKKDVFVNHILIKKFDGRELLIKSIKDSLDKGVSFKVLAKQHSKDPSVIKNGGALGWVSVGQVVPEFQSAAFSLCVGCVGVAETDFGVHIIKVDSVRQSNYATLNIEEYNDLAFRFSTAYIKGSLSDLAAQHDSLLLLNSGVSFNVVLLSNIINQIAADRGVDNTKSRREVDVVDILKNTKGVVAIYNGDLLSPLWFAYKLSSPFYKNVYYESVEELLLEFKTILLRDIAWHKGMEFGLDKGYGFTKQYVGVKNSFLQKEFLSFLIETVKDPTQKELEDYYNNNLNEFFVNKETGKPFSLENSKGTVRALFLQEKQEEVKVAFFNSLKNPDVVLVNQVWLKGGF